MFSLLFLRQSGASAGTYFASTLSDSVLLTPVTSRSAQCITIDTPPLVDNSHSFGGVYFCPHSQLQVLGWLRFDNRRALVAELGLGDSALTDFQLLVSAYHRWQDDCVRHLIGDFSFALYDPQRQSVFMGRDPMGVRPLYYRLERDFLAVSVSPAPLLRIAGASASRDMDWVAQFLLRMSMHHTATAYQEIKKLAPAHRCLVSMDAVKDEAYFAWKDDAPPSRHCDARWVAAYREKLEEAVACRLDSTGVIACENSGGLDSATITGFAAKLIGSHRVHTFGYAILEQEAQYILATSQLHKINRNHIFTEHAELSDADIDAMLSVLAYPAEHGDGPGHKDVYEQCRHWGLTTLLSGFGGDEVVTNPGHHLINELVDQGDWRNLWRVLPGRSTLRGPRLAKCIWRKWNPIQQNPRFASAMQHRWQFQVVRPEIATRLHLQEKFMAQSIYDAPYRRINDFAIQNKLAASYVPTRLENCSLMAAMYGVDYRWPLLDQRLVQQYLSTPSLEKFGSKGVGRYLHRRAMEDIAPPLVQWKPSKDMGIGSHIKAMGAPENVQRLLNKMHAELDRLPSDLHDIIDVQKIRATAANMHKMQGVALLSAQMMSRRAVTALLWLNRWWAREV